MSDGTFVYSPEIGELAKELREALKTGRMTYDEAFEVMKKAIRKVIDEKGQVFKRGEKN